MFEELGISFGTALIVLLTLYFIVKWAVKNGIKEAYRDITGKVTTEDIEAEQICNELGLNENLNSILATFPEWGQKVPPLSLFGGEKRHHIS